MNPTFDQEVFDRLSGGKLGAYALGLAKRGIFPPDCINYFRINANRWDGQHLEAGLMFLSNMHSPDSAHEIVNCIGHKLQHIRFTVLLILKGLNYSDDYMLSKIEEQLPHVSDENEKRFVIEVHSKAKEWISTRRK